MVPDRVAAGFVTGKRECEEALPAGVGVAAADARNLAGGGPIEPSIARPKDFDVDEGVDIPPAVALFTRILFPSAEILDVESDSVDNFRPLVVVLLSDMTEDGREEERATLGVPNTPDSR